MRTVQSFHPSWRNRAHCIVHFLQSRSSYAAKAALLERKYPGDPRIIRYRQRMAELLEIITHVKNLKKI